MTRENIQVFHRDKTIIIQSDKHFFSFSRNQKGIIKAFCTTYLAPEMIMDIIRSGIVGIENRTNDCLVLIPKFGYDILKMQEVIIAIFEKFDL